MSLFAKRLKMLRENKKQHNSKWTQGYVADKIGVARVTYTGYENGTKQPPISTINAIADLFEVSSDYLLGRDRLNPTEDEKAFEKWMNDPTVYKFYKEFSDSPEERREALLAVWEILKSKK